MSANELNIRVVFNSKMKLSEIFNRILVCINSGHNEGKTIAPATFSSKGYNFMYNNKLTKYEDIDWNL